MKILHVWSVAGVSSVIAKYMDKLYNTKSKVIMRRYFDPFALNDEKDLLDDSAKRFILRAILMARKYDIIHIHAVDNPLFLSILRLLYHKKPIILHYHGTDIRNKWNEKKDRLKYVNLVMVSTKDLLDGAPKGVIYLPNPVDTELFKPSVKQKGTALHISYGVDEIAQEIAKRMNLKLIIHDRKRNPIPYKQMPQFLAPYEYYIDVKRDAINGTLLSGSKTGLEALACGCKVINYDLTILDKLPDEHKPENVVSKLYNIYRSLITLY